MIARKYARFSLLILLGFTLLAACAEAAPDLAVDASTQTNSITVYKSATCGCCGEWTTYLEENGFAVEVKETLLLAEIKDEQQVPQELRSCHTALMDGYVIEGHVPVEEINRLLAERPAVLGIAVAGMPVGSPGMEVDGVDAMPFDVMAFDANGNATLFASYPK